jgi:hypothetical protein
MEFSSKKYHIKKIKNYIIKNNLFFFFNGINRKSNDWINIEQEIQNLFFSYYKILNKISRNTLNDSIYANTSPLINSVTFLFKPLINNNNKITKQKILTNFESLLFRLLAIKLNNKVYSKNQLINNFSFKYKENKLLFFQFNTINIKIIVNKNKSK